MSQHTTTAGMAQGPRLTYTLEEVAGQTGLSMEFLRLEIRRGHLPALRVGVGRGRLLVMAVDLRAYLERASRVEAD